MDPNNQDQQYQPGAPQQRPFQPAQQPYMQQPQTPQTPIQPQPVQQPPNYAQQPQASQPMPGSGPNFKKIGIFAVIFLAVTTLIAVLASSFGGGTTTTDSAASLPLTPVESEELTYNVSLPEGWTTNISTDEFYKVVSAAPATSPDTDYSSISISRTSTVTTAENFKISSEAEANEVNTPDYMAKYKLTVTDHDLSSYGNDDEPAYLHSYKVTYEGSDLVHNVQMHYIYQTDGTVVTARFSYTDNFSAVLDSVGPILESYQAK